MAGWLAGPTVAGYFLGASIGDPHRFGLDLVMPAFFAAMLVPLWQGPRRAVGWIVAGVVAVVVAAPRAGCWFILAGALAGALAGGYLDEA